ncbi:hypothetical protein NO932_16725 [Pelagibacterium sp. 26DY04]|uniref:hypothetical protein n=1 Tax=Pelagibacterium sp. 26DY04 TaxID=2967130 RepID=UPI0028159C74|nr:hypothetical protein [Pelagibacterium sp. 26DY04]WMT86534.1 hypothetical protein NO932_16725 [Pelagibacterium sp. 26DY04]
METNETVTGQATNASGWQAFLRFVMIVCVAVVAFPLQATHAPLHPGMAHKAVGETHSAAMAMFEQEPGGAGFAQHDSSDHVHETPMAIEPGAAHGPERPGAWGALHPDAQLSGVPTRIEQPPRSV